MQSDAAKQFKKIVDEIGAAGCRLGAVLRLLAPFDRLLDSLIGDVADPRLDHLKAKARKQKIKRKVRRRQARRLVKHY